MTFMEWLKNENNPVLEQSEYLYGTRHITLLVLTVLLCFGIYFLFRKRSDKAKNVFLYLCGTIFLLFEIASRVVSLVFATSYTIKSVVEIVLPMHICSIMVWVFIIGVFFKKKWLLRYGAIMGLLSTLAFLVYPAVGINQKYMAFTNVYSTFTHMLGFIFCISLMSLRIVNFRFKTIWQPYLLTIIMFGYGYLLNWVIFPGSDYMYMRNDPLGLKLSYPYQYLYALILVIYIFMFYFINLFTRKKIKTIETNVIKESETVDSVKEALIQENNDIELTTTQQLVLKMMKDNNKISKKQLAMDTNLTDAELEKIIKYLKSVGKLERIGNGKGGYWQVN